MSKARNSFETMAADAAKRLDDVRATGQQLSLLPDEAGPTPIEAGTGQPGRPKGAQGKGSSQLRRWLQARGYRMPEEQLSQIAGLASGEGPALTAMAQAEQMLAWAWADNPAGKQPSPEQRLSVFLQLYAMALRASEALLPYGTPKAGEDKAGPLVVQFNVPGGAAPDGAASARDVTPARHALAPADVRAKMKRNQHVSDAQDSGSDDGASDG